MEPTISLLMPNYNKEKYIQEAIKSALKQTYFNWELIIVDDGSTDNSIKNIQRYSNDNRIKIIKHKNNAGCSAALRTAIHYSTAPLIGILDSDDILHESALTVMVKAHQKYQQHGLIYSTYFECNEDLIIKGIAKWISTLKSSQTNLIRPVTSHFKTFKRASYNQTRGFDLTQKRAVDRDLIYKLEEVTKFKFIKHPLYYYRRNKTGISQANNLPQAQLYDIIAKYKAYHRRKDTKIPNITKAKLIELLSVCINYCDNSNDYKDMMQQFMNLKKELQESY